MPKGSNFKIEIADLLRVSCPSSLLVLLVAESKDLDHSPETGIPAKNASPFKLTSLLLASRNNVLAEKFQGFNIWSVRIDFSSNNVENKIFFPLKPDFRGNDNFVRPKARP